MCDNLAMASHGKTIAALERRMEETALSRTDSGVAADDELSRPGSAGATVHNDADGDTDDDCNHADDIDDHYEASRGYPHVPGPDLRQRWNYNKYEVENLDIYYPVMKQLQIKPERLEVFFLAVLKVFRQKNFAVIRRGTAKAYEQLTAHFLRGFAKKIWYPGSEWLVISDNVKPLVFRAGGKNPR